MKTRKRKSVIEVKKNVYETIAEKKIEGVIKLSIRGRSVLEVFLVPYEQDSETSLKFNLFFLSFLVQIVYIYG